MYKIVLLLLLSVITSLGQKSFLPDSLDIYSIFYYKNLGAYQDSLKSKQTVMDEFEKQFADNFNTQKVYSKILTGNIDVLEMDLFDQRNAELAFLEKNKNALGELLFNKLSNEAKYNYWHYIFAYPILRGNANQVIKRVSGLPAVITKDLPQNIFKNDELLHVKSYRKFIYYYISYQNSKNRGFEKYSNILQAATDKSEFAMSTFSKEIKDFSIADVLTKHKEGLKTGTAKSLISQIENDSIRIFFQGKFLDDILKMEEVAKKKLEEDQIKKNGAVALTDLEGKAFGFEKYLGKVVYVDFWASWCGPCRIEFPHSKNMKSSLSEEEAKKIIFLNISIDDSKDAWKEAIKTLGIENFEHGHSEGGWSSKVVQKFEIRGIPRYMIIDKTGKIIKTNASRPSAPETIDELRLLAK
jgi:thiol-disulfide isomerase/thioredoxin